MSADEKPQENKVDIDQSSNDRDQSCGSTSEPLANSTDNKRPIGSTPIDIKPNDGGIYHKGPGNSRKQPSPNPEKAPTVDFLKTANTLSSMMMAHRIALEDDFRLEPGTDMSGPLMSLSPIIGSSPSQDGSDPSLQSRVKDIVHDAYWDLFREEIDSQTNPNVEERSYSISRQLLCDIRQKIIELLLPQHDKLKQDIEDRLNTDVMDQLAKVHSLYLKEYSDYILDVLSKLCAPVRDEKIQEIMVTSDIVQRYRGIMDLLELMRMDFANFTLNRFKPHIKAHSQEYEREKFNEILKQQQSIGIDGLEFTKVWLARAVERIDESHGISDLINEAKQTTTVSTEELDKSMTTTTTSNTSKINRPSLPLKDKILMSEVIDKVLNAGYCELLEWSNELQPLYPETLLFDEATFKQLGEQTRTLILTSSILLTTFAFANRFRVNDNMEFKNLIKSHVITLLTAAYEDTKNGTQKIQSNDLLDQTKLETIAAQLIENLRRKVSEDNENLLTDLENQREIFRRQILDLQSSSNRIKELSRRRIIEFIETLLTLDVKHQQKKFAKMPPPVNIPLGLNCLTDEITLTTAQLVKIIRYNRRVFYQHYQDIILDMVIKKCQDSH